MHIETVNLADGDYELVSADSRVDQEVNLNCANLSQDLGQAPEAFLPDSAQEGKPRCMIPLFSRIFTFMYYIYLSLGVDRNHRCMSLGTYVCYANLFLDQLLR